ncbi:MAG: phosphate ABC transporter substrate-binding protein [Bacteroidia bacterium]|nr:phosphate ABC transporter substrate-binding protein [Bacteroidia bacterium]
MKKLSIMVMVMALISAAITGAIAQKKVVCKVKGSDTCLPLLQKESETFMKNNAGSSITVIGGGSGVGFAALQNGTTDVAMASRSMKMDEKMKMQDAGKNNIKEVIISYDAISVIVNPANKVSQLTREQLEGIFTGKIKNWKEVGGDDQTIVAYSRESSSGTFEFFKEHVLKGKNYGTGILLMPATGAIVQSVTQTKGAIGYVGIAYVNKDVKALKVSYDKGKTYIEPSVQTAMNKTYPITRPLYLYYLGSVESKVKPFVDYILSSDGQKIVQQEGYVPLGK